MADEKKPKPPPEPRAGDERFVPVAQDGWRVARLDEEGRVRFDHVAGWLGIPEGSSDGSVTVWCAAIHRAGSRWVEAATDGVVLGPRDRAVVHDGVLRTWRPDDDEDDETEK